MPISKEEQYLIRRITETLEELRKNGEAPKIGKALLELCQEEPKINFATAEEDVCIYTDLQTLWCKIFAEAQKKEFYSLARIARNNSSTN